MQPHTQTLSSPAQGPEHTDIDTEFFAAGEMAHSIVDDEPLVTVSPRHAQKMTAAARARRAHLSRYVTLAVTAAAGILVLGVTAKLRQTPSTASARVAAAVAAPPAATFTEAAAAVTTEPERVAQIEPAPTVESVTEEKPVVTTVKVDQVEKPAANAGQAKQVAKAALERGESATAISAGERSVVLDGSDAEAWLVLGAAYQASGNAGRAKRCYTSCVSQGSKGPVDECRDLLSTL